MGDHDGGGSADADGEPEAEGGGHEPGGVHATRLGRTHAGDRRTREVSATLRGSFIIRPPRVNLPGRPWQGGRSDARTAARRRRTRSGERTSYARGVPAGA